MSWKFWIRKQKKEEKLSQIQVLQENITSLHNRMEMLDEQLKKMMRMQFKGSKNMEDKMEELNASLMLLERERKLVQQYKQKERRSSTHIIRLLDELDHVSSELNESEQGWQMVLGEWSKMLMNSLEKMGVYQIDVIGKTFDPELSESLQAVEKKVLTTLPVVPYQIVKVLNRGYVSEDGKLIRKAKVVTVKENDE